MTTIAWRNGILAFDSQRTNGNFKRESGVAKCIKTTEYLVGGVGQQDYIQAFCEWVKDGMLPHRKPKGSKESTFFIIDRKGNITEYFEEMLPSRMGKLRFDAWGSGGDYAIGALELGATAVEAVRVASRYDVYTGGRIRTLSFK